jgi:sporulation protein YlmC with PRC-barrel domain
LKISAVRRNGGGVNLFSLDHFILREKPMFTKSVAAGVAASALLASVAFAQTSTTTDRANTMTPTAPTATTTNSAASNSSFTGDWRASKVVGLNVYNDQNESIGSINDLLMDKSGGVKAAVISVGGFLGVGAHLVAVPYEKVKFVTEPVPYTGTANTAQPAPGTSRPSSTTTTGAATTSAPPAKANPWYPDHAVYNATKDELKAMPEFTYTE